MIVCDGLIIVLSLILVGPRRYLYLIEYQLLENFVIALLNDPIEYQPPRVSLRVRMSLVQRYMSRIEFAFRQQTSFHLLFFFFAFLQLETRSVRDVDGGDCQCCLIK